MSGREVVRYSRSRNNENAMDAPTARIGHRETGRRKPSDKVSGRDSLPYNQEVTDAQGRRRFHGAFTGGWSAGYFNTVGSKEGWKPSQFVSSRSKRAQQQSARPEDFMDAEDLAEAAEAGKTIVMQKDFAGERQANKRAEPTDSETQLQGMLSVKAESIGRQLLRTMGWREGREIGEDGKKATKKVYGVSLPPQMSKAEKRFHKITGLYRTALKEDFRGLGYEGYADTIAPPPSSSKTVTFGPGRASSTAGLGLSALESAGSYDDYYTSSSMSNYDIDIDVSAASQRTARDQNGLRDNSKQNMLKGLRSEIASLSFVQASKDGTPPQEYPPIEVPREFTGVHRFQHDQVLLSGSISKMQSAQNYVNSATRQREHSQLTIDQRRKMLGEKRLPGPAPPKVLQDKLSKEVIELINEKDREKLARSLESGFRTASDNYKCIERPDAWKKQFAASDPQKQIRFERFLQVMAGTRDAKTIPRHNLTNWQYQRELEEFRALYNGKFKPGAANFKGETKDDPEHDCKTAAKLGMYGRLTRRKVAWVPDRLLCLRFNVPDPYKGRTLPKVSKRATKSQKQYQETISILKGSNARRQMRIEGPSKLSRTSVAALTEGKGISFVAKAVYHPTGTTSSSSTGTTNAGTSSMSKSDDWEKIFHNSREAADAAASGRGLGKKNRNDDNDDDDDDDDDGPMGAGGVGGVGMQKPKVDLFKAIFDDEGDDGMSDEDSSDNDDDEGDEDEEIEKDLSLEQQAQSKDGDDTDEKNTIQGNRSRSHQAPSGSGGGNCEEKNPKNAQSAMEEEKTGFSKGAKILYKNEEIVTLVEVHRDPAGDFYTVKKSDGSEVQTVPKHLKPLSTEEIARIEDEAKRKQSVSVFVSSSDDDDSSSDDHKKKKKKKSRKKRKKKKEKKSKKEKKKKKKRTRD